MRTKGSNKDVARAFAQGRTEFSNGKGTFYIEDGVLYSYGSHFPMARIRGDVVLVTADTYSNTTQRHFSLMYRALHGGSRKILHVKVVRAVSHVEHRDNLDDYVQRLKDLSELSWKKRTEHTLSAVVDDFQHTLAQAKLYRDTFLPGYACKYIDGGNMFVIKSHIRRAA